MRKLNRELLAKAQHKILDSPAVFNISDFETDVAGFVVAAAGADPQEIGADPYLQAKQLLGASKSQMDALCFLERWPVSIRKEFISRPMTMRELKANSRLAAARIGIFAATGR